MTSIKAAAWPPTEMASAMASAMAPAMETASAEMAMVAAAAETAPAMAEPYGCGHGLTAATCHAISTESPSALERREPDSYGQKKGVEA
jgi:hypothetical protein